MNEMEQLNQSKEQLKESFGTFTSDLKNYTQARFLNFKVNVVQKVSSAKGKLGNLKNSFLEKLNPTNLDVKFRNIVEQAEIKGLELVSSGKEKIQEAKDTVNEFVTDQIANYYINQEQREEQRRIAAEERAREEAIKANTRDHKIGMREALREQARQEREARFLNFKENIRQKVSSAKGKLGNLKNSLLEKLNPTNLDVKFRNIVEQAEIKGLELVSSGKEKIQEAKDTVNEFVTDQIANYYINQEQREEQRRIAAEERAREEAIKANTRDHKIGMREALREQARQEREARFLNFKENAIQKVSSVKGKLGNLKNSLLEKLNPTNLDVKFRNIVEQVEIKGLELVSSGKEKVTEVKDKVETFAATQIANYYERKAEKIEAKQFREAARQAELEEIQRMKQQRRERKAAMKEALAGREREMYEQKHLENEQRKAELMREVFGDAEVEQEMRVARAM